MGEAQHAALSLGLGLHTHGIETMEEHRGDLGSAQGAFFQNAGLDILYLSR